MNAATTRIGSWADRIPTVQKATGELHSLAFTTESQIRTVAKVFEAVAGDTNSLMNLAAAIVDCVEKENISSVLPRMQTLGAAVRRFIEDRLQATAGILDMVTTVAKLLRQLSVVSRGQAEIAFKIKALSVLTNLEVAHLGAVGAGFRYLANELDDFSKSVIKDTLELASHAENRRLAIEETGRVLSAELPRRRKELARIEADLDGALAVVDFSLTELSRTPSQFKICVEDVARQIAGAVAAIQAHDITRQQIEHVQEGFAIIASRMLGSPIPEAQDSQALPQAYAGLAIQIFQLRTVDETVARWASQIRTCMSGILTVSANELVGIGPAALEQEREVSSQLGRIERLESEGQAQSGTIRRNLEGLSSLLQLVSEHVQRSKSIRDRLRLLTFNSIIEASRLGTQAAAILAIAECIKGVAAEWNQITDQSGAAMREMVNVAKQMKEAMEIFSEAGSELLREEQAETRACLDNLRAAAAAAATHAREMKVVTDRMQAKIAEVGNTCSLLDACFGRIGPMIVEIESLKLEMEGRHPDLNQRYDAAEVERLFSASYTTEMERVVLQAALGGKALPIAQSEFAGNSVELF
jgi:hypothetical protein